MERADDVYPGNNHSSTSIIFFVLDSWVNIIWPLNSVFLEPCHETKWHQCRGGSRISKGGVDGRPYLLRGGRENALTKKIGNNKFYLYLFTPCFLISKYSPDVVQL